MTPTGAPLSILLVGDYPPDQTLGSPKVFFKLRQEFEQLGHQCDMLLAPDIAGPSSRQVRQLLSPWLAGRVIMQRLDESRIDVVDAAGAEGLGFAVARQMGKHRSTAFVCRSNGLEHRNYQRMLDDASDGLVSKPWTRRVWYPASRLSQVSAAARAADRLLLLNEGDRRYALARGWQSADRIDLVPHGVADEFLASDPGDDAPRGQGLLFCGSWDIVKGVPYLVRAFQQLHEAGSRHALTILGPGVPASAVLEAFEPHVRSSIRVIDRAPEDLVRRAYREHDVLLWPSTYEGFGLVLIEAMSQRMPVVATSVGCATSLIRDNVNGVLVAPRDPSALAGAVARLMGDATARRRLGAAARSTVDGLSWRACAEHTIRSYRRAIEDRP